MAPPGDAGRRSRVWSQPLVRAGGLRRGQQAARALERLPSAIRRSRPICRGIPAAYWSVRPAPPGPEGEEQLLLRGAVLVRVRGRRLSTIAAGSAKPSEHDGAPSPLSPELAAALAEPPSRPGRVLLRCCALMVCCPSRPAAGPRCRGGRAWCSRACLARAVRPRPRARAVGQRLGAMGLVLALGPCCCCWNCLLPVGSCAPGRQLEVRLRMALLEKLPRLGDRYFQSRPTSDMAERSHSLHRLRLLPEFGGQTAPAEFRAAPDHGGHCLAPPGKRTAGDPGGGVRPWRPPHRTASPDRARLPRTYPRRRVEPLLSGYSPGAHGGPHPWGRADYPG